MKELAKGKKGLIPLAAMVVFFHREKLDKGSYLIDKMLCVGKSLIYMEVMIGAVFSSDEIDMHKEKNVSVKEYHL